MEENFISYDRYREICAEEKIPGYAAQDTLVDFLNDLGVILHFKDFHLQETQVLEPRWITTAVYKIINSPILAAGHGVLALSSLGEILKPAPVKNPVSVIRRTNTLTSCN
jgi:internalin A